MKKLLALFVALSSLPAMAGNVTLALNGGPVAAPSCETQVQAKRVDGVIRLYLNGGKFCNSAVASNNGTRVGAIGLPRLFGSYGGESIDLPEVAGMNDYVVDFSGNGRSDRLFLKVNKVSIGAKVDVRVNVSDAPTAELTKCGGMVSVERDVLGDVTVTFSGVDSCQYGTLLSRDGSPAPTPVNFGFNAQNGFTSVRTIGREYIRASGSTTVYKLWSRPSPEGYVIRENVEVYIK